MVEGTAFETRQGLTPLRGSNPLASAGLLINNFIMSKSVFWVLIVLIVILSIGTGVYGYLKWQKTPDQTPAPEIFTFVDATRQKSVTAQFLTDSMILKSADLGEVELPRAISGSGARYANSDESLVFWNKGDNATIYQKEQVIFEGSVAK